MVPAAAAAPVELVGTVGKEEPAPPAAPAAWAGEPSFLVQGELTNRNGAHGKSMDQQAKFRYVSMKLDDRRKHWDSSN